MTDAGRCCILHTRNVFGVKMQDDPRDTTRRIAALAGVPLAEERSADLAPMLAVAQAMAAALAAVDFRDADPATPFPPRAKAAP